MLSQLEIKEILRNHREFLATEFGVREIGFFGSYAKGEAGEESDIDLVIAFSRPIGFQFIELAEYLEQILGNPVDILTPAGIESIRISEVAECIRENLVYV